MRCPSCNTEMEKGKLRSRGGVFFLPDGESLPLLYTENEMQKHHAVCLPPSLFSIKAEYPTAYLCRKCSKIIIDY